MGSGSLGDQASWNRSKALAGARGGVAGRPDGVSVLAILPLPAVPIEAHAADPLGLVKRFLGGVDERPASVS
jgi:hypothetical protein